MGFVSSSSLDRFGGLCMLVEASGSIAGWSAGFAELTGLDGVDVRGRRPGELGAVVAEAGRLDEVVAATLADRRARQIETTWRAAGGAERSLMLASAADEAACLLTGVDITELAAARDAGVARVRSLFDQAPDGIFVADLDGRYTDVNEAGCRMLGFARDEILGMRITDLLPPEDHERLWAAREEMLGRGPHLSEWRLRRRDGRYLPVEVSAKILPDGRWQGFVRDVSERRRHVEALRLSEERFRVSLQASPTVVFNQDRELRYTWIHNPRQPFASETVLGKTDRELLSPEDAEPLTRIKQRVLETGRGVREVVRTTIEGVPYHYDLTVEPLRDGDGRLVGVTCASWDVTERRQIEDEQRFLAGVGEVLMRATLDYGTTLTELAQLAVGALADCVIVDVVDDGQVRRLRVACADPGRRHVAERLERLPIDRTRPHLAHEAIEERRAVLVAEITPGYLEARTQGPEHAELLRGLDPRSLIAVPLVARGRLLGAVVLVSSRSSRRYGERDLRLAEQLARVAALAVDNAHLHGAAQQAIRGRDEVLGIVAHDLRSPLNTALLQCDLLELRGGDADRRDPRPVQAIRRSALTMSRLIQDILDVSRLEAGTLAIERAGVPVPQVIDEAIEARRTAAAHAGVGLRAEVAEGLPDVHADRGRLQQVLDNLIGNAIKFTGPGGGILVEARPGPGEVVFRVADTGCGIRPDHLSHLFDRFWQGEARDRRGAGLGLSIVRGIVEAHGGRVWVDSEVGRGTTFHFTVPTARPRPSG